MRASAFDPERVDKGMAKILIVDDEHDVVQMIRLLLKGNGYEVSDAPNGLAALRVFQTYFFDMIITDLRMPCMDGMSFLHEVKKLDPAIPVIILTAYDSPATACEAMKGGASVYMAKPFDIDQLLNVVKRMLGSAKSR